MMITQWVSHMGRLSRDGYHLARAVVQARGQPSQNTFKSILLDTAKQSNNAVSISLLYMEKEIGLVRYHGFLPYLRQRYPTSRLLGVVHPATNHNANVQDGGPDLALSLQGNNPSGNSNSPLKSTFSTTTTTTTGSTSSSNSPHTTNNNHSTVKIAFMVTASMKQELSQELGYSVDQIKSMTPLQASLILNHSISPDRLKVDLAKAEQDYEEQQRLDMEKAQTMTKEEEENLKSDISQQHQQQHQQHLHDQMQSTTSQPPSPSSETSFATTSTSSSTSFASHSSSSNSTSMFFGALSGGSFMSHNELDNKNNNHHHQMTSGKNTASTPATATVVDFGVSEWFEVTETNEKGESTRVALYLQREEAELGRKARQEIANAKSKDVKFEVHTILPKDL